MKKVINLFQYLIYTLIITLSFTEITAQTTSIPDSNFEQALIDKGIDSDATINGEVLTTDIDGITELDLAEQWGYNIADITGIEDFISLEVLDISRNPITGTLDLTSNINLKELYNNTCCGDVIENRIEEINLSNNAFIEIIEVRNSAYLKILNLKNVNHSDVSNISIDFYHEGFPENNPTEPINSVCIQVNNSSAASQNTGVYSNWNINTSSYIDYNFNEDCTLSSEKFVNNEIKLFPNPATETFHIKSSEGIKEVKIYSLQGKLVKEFASSQQSYSVTDLQKGVYLLSLEKQKTRTLLKLIVE